MMLTQKQERFCLAYLELNNASDAYRRVYSTSSMKPETVNRTAHDLLKNPKIAARINELRANVAEKACLTEARVLEEVARIGLFDPRKLFNADGSPKEITELDDATAAAIAGLEVTEQYAGTGENRVFIGYLKKYKIADKNSALEKLMKHLGMFEKDNQQRAGLLDKVPAATLRTIEEKLSELSGIGVAGKPGAGSSSRVTH